MSIKNYWSLCEHKARSENMRKSALNYYRRIFSAYLTRATSQLTFWHGIPRVNENTSTKELGEYYMPFFHKADYQGHFDEHGIPLLDYKGKIGKQYNPIAIAQYGLGNYNLFKRNGNKERYDRFIKASDWLVDNLEQNKKGLWVWNHKFDWEYYQILKAPWYSALAQGQGISLLVRAFIEEKEDKYLAVSVKAFETLTKEIREGGVLFVDKDGNYWLEEYLVNPPSHVLNGFIWAIWGIYDYFLITREKKAFALYQNYLKTIRKNLHRYDTGFWSLYDLANNRLKTIASSFYHQLHIVQLDVLYKLTGDNIFLEYSKKWTEYKRKKINVLRATCYKSVFKLIYY